MFCLALSLAIAIPGTGFAQRDPSEGSKFHREFETPTPQSILNIDANGNIERVSNEDKESEQIHRDETITANETEQQESQTAETIHEQEAAHARAVHHVENETTPPTSLDQQIPE